MPRIASRISKSSNSWSVPDFRDVQPTRDRTGSKTDFSSPVENLTQAVDHLLAQGAGRFEVARNQQSGEVTLKITSSLPNRAPIEVLFDEDFGAYLTIGKESVFEVRGGNQNSGDQDFSAHVLALVASVIKNGFEENVLVSEGKILGASGIIRATGTLKTDIRESWRKISWNVFARKAWEHYRYLPY